MKIAYSEPFGFAKAIEQLPYGSIARRADDDPRPLMMRDRDLGVALS